MLPLTVQGALAALEYVRGLPTRDGWTRPDSARVPLAYAKALSADGLMEMRAVGGGLIEVKLTPSALVMIANAGKVRQ